MKSARAGQHAQAGRDSHIAGTHVQRVVAVKRRLEDFPVGEGADGAHGLAVLRRVAHRRGARGLHLAVGRHRVNNLAASRAVAVRAASLRAE
jgi:hypothetical protein